MTNASGDGAARRILHIEKWTEATNAFIQELHEGTHASIEHAEILETALSKINARHGSIDLVLYTANPATTNVLGFPESVRAMAWEGCFRSPHFILLATNPLPLPCAARCIDWQITSLLREYPKQIIETVRAQLWKIRASKPGPMIRVEFRRGRYRFFICTPTTSEEIVVSRQVGRLLLLLLRGVRNVDDLADELDVLPRSVKKYVFTLRWIIEALLERMNMAESNVEVVWMRKGPGGTLCGLQANPVWA